MIVEATALLTAAMRKVVLAPGSLRFVGGRNVRLNVS